MMLGDLEKKLATSSEGRRLSLQAIITKIDELPVSQSEALKVIDTMKKEIYDCAPSSLNSILTAFTKQHTLGVEEVRKSMMECTSHKL